MKKMICLALVVLTILCVFTGCSGTAYTTNGYGNGGMGYNNAMNGRNGRSNVSTSRNGMVNGKNGTNNGNSTNRSRSNMPNVGMDVEIGTNVR